MTDDDRTVFVPASGSVPAPPEPPVSQPPVSQPPAGATSLPPTGYTQMAPRTDVGRIQPGDVLNHIFEVKRFLARGGMGEVFEGCNVTSDERVAIKVMLPALAADPNVQAMFRKEARTLTRLSHPALVQYRVLAQEPQLGVLYIVTEFIEGSNLDDVLGTVKADEADLVALLKRLAAGLQAAHALGAIHRDISPDNVLLEHGELGKARIIDFGIAKDLDPGSKTIIGEGFAGKLSYVAPEQLGDFNREVGPWTDVYSLALVILAVAGGGGIDLGGSFVDAIDKRRKGVSLDKAPAGLRPVLGAMLAPNPADRLRSMDAVLAALSGAPTAAVAVDKPKKAPKPAKVAAPKPVRDPAAKSGIPKPMIAAGAAAALMMVAGGAWFATRGGDAAPDATATNTEASAAPAKPSAAGAVAAVTAALPQIDCSWLDLANEASGGAAMTLKLMGVAGRPAEAQAAIAKVVEGTGTALGSADFSDVAPVSASECSAINAFRAIRADGPVHLSVPQRTFEMARLEAGSTFAGQIGAKTIMNLDLSGVRDFALYGLEPSGAISPVMTDRKMFDAFPKTGVPISDLGGGKYRFTIDSNNSGWSGYLLLTGDGGFSDELVASTTGVRAADWPQRFAAAAAAGHWKSEMVWFKMVDEVPN
ncbi:serine/threonine-protein kinase [Sphingomonas sp.]|uniref:serine/threonine-protein kinase n=1 Tax=Sphingomonas sp. TaxID=28214 RepID=UPI0035BBDDC0